MSNYKNNINQFNLELKNLESVKQLSEHYKVNIDTVIKELQPRIKTFYRDSYKNHEISINFIDTNTQIKVSYTKNFTDIN